MLILTHATASQYCCDASIVILAKLINAGSLRWRKLLLLLLQCYCRHTSAAETVASTIAVLQSVPLLLPAYLLLLQSLLLLLLAATTVALRVIAYCNFKYLPNRLLRQYPVGCILHKCAAQVINHFRASCFALLFIYSIASCSALGYYTVTATSNLPCRVYDT
jgi:hypothetical protein